MNYAARWHFYLSQSENLEVAQIYWQDQEAGLDN